MTRLDNYLSPKTKADLQKLIDPLASYIAAASQSRIVLTTAVSLLIQSLHEINCAANHYLNSICENHVS
jgi:hypothetical protein